MANNREIIARNIADMLHDGDVVNLGVGIPTMVSNYLPEEYTIFLHAENGALGMASALDDPYDITDRKSVMDWMEAHKGDKGDWRTGHAELCNANSSLCTLMPGACCFDTNVSFAIARGGHLDATILGGLQVDEEFNLANWMVPGKVVNGMGGAMDLVAGTKKVVVAMEHCTKKGEPKILKKCTMPLTAVNCVTDIVTELCVIECTDGKLIVRKMAPGVTKEELQAKTEATLTFPEEIGEMVIPE